MNNIFVKSSRSKGTLPDFREMLKERNLFRFLYNRIAVNLGSPPAPNSECVITHRRRLRQRVPKGTRRRRVITHPSR